MIQPKFKTEVELARVVVSYLCDNGWEVYQEVNTGQCAPTCDIVAKRGLVIWAVECKLAMNLEVVAQAANWRYRAHFSSVAVPLKSITHSAEELLRELGIGCMGVRPALDEWNPPLVNSRMGLMRRPRRKSLAEFLRDEHKTWAEAGTNKGGRFSPFKATCRDVARHVSESPGISLKDLMKVLKHHYSSDASARGCIAKWAEAGSIEGVKLVRDGSRIALYPTDHPVTQPVIQSEGALLI